jgi:hypothetical protein
MREVLLVEREAEAAYCRASPDDFAVLYSLERHSADLCGKLAKD